MPASDKYAGRSNAPSSPATGGEAVTPHDTNELAKVSRAIRVGGAGNVAVVTSDGSEFTIPNMYAGETLAIRVKKIKATGTTATGITAFN